MIDNIRSCLFKALNETGGGSVILDAKEPYSVLRNYEPKNSQELTKTILKRKIANANNSLENILNNKLITTNSKIKKEI